MRADPQALGSALIFRSADGVVFEVLGDGESDELGFGAGFARVDAALHFGAEAVGEADGHWGGCPLRVRSGVWWRGPCGVPRDWPRSRGLRRRTFVAI